MKDPRTQRTLLDQFLHWLPLAILLLVLVLTVGRAIYEKMSENAESLQKINIQQKK